jgi:hypothetical protein
MNIFDAIMWAIGLGTTAIAMAAIVWGIFTLLNEYIGNRQADKADRARANRARVRSQMWVTDEWNGVTECGYVMHNDGVTTRKVATWSEISPRDRRIVVRAGELRWTANTTDEAMVLVADYMAAQGW